MKGELMALETGVGVGERSSEFTYRNCRQEFSSKTTAENLADFSNLDDATAVIIYTPKPVNTIPRCKTLEFHFNMAPSLL